MYPEKSFNASSRYSPVMSAAAFFPPGLDPVLNRGERDKDPVVTPEMPGGTAIGQAVFHDQPDGGMDDAMRVMALGQGQVVHVGVEIGVAAGTAMLGVVYLKLARSAGDRIAQVMQLAGGGAKAISAPLALRAATTRVIAASLDNERVGQIFNACDPLSDVRHIPSWRCHTDFLQKHWTFWIRRHSDAPIRSNYSVTVLQSRYFWSCASSRMIR
jgi:hypothetical protein